MRRKSQSPDHAPSAADLELLADGALEVREAARFTGVGVRTLWRAAATNQIRTFRNGRRVLWPKRGLVQWLATQPGSRPRC